MAHVKGQSLLIDNSGIGDERLAWQRSCKLKQILPADIISPVFTYFNYRDFTNLI